MLGLVVIILLLVLIGAFYIRFASKEAPDFAQTEKVEIQLQQYMDAFMMMTVCPGKDMTEAMKLCASSDRGEICGKNSCDLVEEYASGSLGALFKEKFEAGLIKFTLQDAQTEPDKTYVEVGKDYSCDRDETYQDKIIHGAKAYAVTVWCGT